MRHFVLIRSSYGPQWDTEANRRRLEITKALTIPSLANQTLPDSFQVVVLLNQNDELMEERYHAWLKLGRRRFATLSVDLEGTPAEVAYQGYKIDWLSALRLQDDDTITTRLDDDDGFHPTTMQRVRAAAIASVESRRAAGEEVGAFALMNPIGIRVFGNRYSQVRHDTNAMHSLFTPAGCRQHVYEYGHKHVARRFPVMEVDRKIAWLWYRHGDTLSGHKGASRSLTDEVRAMFPIDWEALRGK